MGDAFGHPVIGERDRMIFSPARVGFKPLLGCIFCCFCLILSQPSSAAIILPQADGGLLTLPDPAQRIITLAPNLAELVFAAGAGKRLAAVVEYSHFPAEVTDIPRIGDAFRIDLERIIEIEPDLIIAWSSGNPKTALEKLEILGFKVWKIEITLPEEIPTAVENIALAAGTGSVGELHARQLRLRLQSLRQKYSAVTPVDYFYQVAARPLYTINGQHLISHSLELCGGRNIFSGLSSLAPQISRESVILADPRAMIAPETPGQPHALDMWREWPRLQAVQHQALLYLPADEISQATPRFLDSIDLACKLLHAVRETKR